LVVDDSEMFRSVLFKLLDRSGFDVEVAADGEEAWDALQHDHYDLLVTDEDMPRLAGLELIRRIRDAGMSLPIIMVSASVSAEWVRNSVHLQIAAVMPKPFVFQAFLSTVRNVLWRSVAANAAVQRGIARRPFPPTQPGAQAVKPEPAQVLLADDDPTVRGSLAAVLESEGYRVDEASNGLEAVTRATQHEPDLVLLDLNMPCADGWQAFKQLDWVTPLLPVIVITARPGQYREAVRVGVDAFMEKPLIIPVLVRAIKHLISEDEDSHVRRITNRAFVTQWLGSVGACGPVY